MEQLQLLRLHQLLSEAAGTTGRPAQMSGGQQQARQSSGAVQFEFGKPVGEVSSWYCKCKGQNFDLVSALGRLKNSWVTPWHVMVLFTAACG
ncbi:hypothetical protein ABBQ38_012599 [Trebouxia sp. C0009 RCD-2024]